MASLSARYTYDAVGNRLTEETEGSLVNAYTYDAANRLTSVDGVTYTWDDGETSFAGNLLSDGMNTYSYDHANRLIGVSPPSMVSNYRYNGLGERLLQATGGVTTTFTMDLAAGLTQVLADGTNTYLYGAGRIAQYDATSVQYFLADAGRKGHASGSVRQLVDDSGEVTLVKGYKP
jgi:YD repeat-containing protein